MYCSKKDKVAAIWQRIQAICKTEQYLKRYIIQQYFSKVHELDIIKMTDEEIRTIVDALQHSKMQNILAV